MNLKSQKGKSTDFNLGNLPQKYYRYALSLCVFYQKSLGVEVIWRTPDLTAFSIKIVSLNISYHPVYKVVECKYN